MDTEREELHNRLTNRHKSDSSKKAWKRHHSNYMRGARERERNTMNKSFYGVAKEIEATLSEANMQKDNVFEQECVISFDNISGGVGIKVNTEAGTISISTTLEETGAGAYRPVNIQDETQYKTIYNGLKEDLLNLCKHLDEELTQVLAKHGLKSTK